MMGESLVGLGFILGMVFCRRRVALLGNPLKLPLEVMSSECIDNPWKIQPILFFSSTEV